MAMLNNQMVSSSCHVLPNPSYLPSGNICTSGNAWQHAIHLLSQVVLAMQAEAWASTEMVGVYEVTSE